MRCFGGKCWFNVLQAGWMFCLNLTWMQSCIIPNSNAVNLSDKTHCEKQHCCEHRTCFSDDPHCHSSLKSAWMNHSAAGLCDCESMFKMGLPWLLLLELVLYAGCFICGVIAAAWMTLTQVTIVNHRHNDRSLLFCGHWKYKKIDYCLQKTKTHYNSLTHYSEYQNAHS